MKNLSEKITTYLIRENYAEESKREIYEYGFKLIIADCINFVLIMIIGIILNSFTVSLIFLAVFCFLRWFSGGFHAKSHIVCRLSMITTFVCVAGCTEIIDLTFWWLIVFLVISVVLIGVLAPIENINKPLSVENRKRNKFRSVFISMIFWTISLLLYYFGQKKYSEVIVFTILSTVILMIIGIYVNKRRCLE